jgi:hypothetical protein
LNDDVVTVGDSLLRGIGRHANAEFLWLNLGWASDKHCVSSSLSIGSRMSQVARNWVDISLALRRIL